MKTAVSKNKDSIIRVRVGYKKPSLGITVCHPRDWFFYPTLTLMIDPYAAFTCDLQTADIQMRRLISIFTVYLLVFFVYSNNYNMKPTKSLSGFTWCPKLHDFTLMASWILGLVLLSDRTPYFGSEYVFVRQSEPVGLFSRDVDQTKKCIINTFWSSLAWPGRPSLYITGYRARSDVVASETSKVGSCSRLPETTMLAQTAGIILVLSLFNVFANVSG